MPDWYTVPPMYGGETVAVVASGQTLTTKQVRTLVRARLAGKCRITAVNDGVWPVWGLCDWLHASDFKWWEWFIQETQHFPGIKTTLTEMVPPRWAKCIKNTGVQGFDPNPANCRSGSNSAYQQVHNLIHAGAARIILLGVDMQGEHYFGAHKDRIVPDYEDVMLPHWPGLVPTLTERKIEVLNASPRSALTTFPVVDLEKVLA